MKKIQYFFCLLAFALMGYSSGLRADDIDIYVSNSSNIGVPNVLFVIDNGADFSANANIGCSSYSDGSGTAPSTGTTTTAGVLQCSLVAALSGLSNSVVNIGVMVSNANNFAETQTTTDETKGGYHEACNSGGNGGCLLRQFRLMDSTNKTNMIKFIKGWQLSNSNGGNTVDQFLIKVNSSLQASTMQEAWAYFNGRTGLSGKTYSPSVLANGCQRNFIIYISNTQKNPSSSEAGAASAALVSAGGTTSNPITGAIKFTTGICPTNQLPAGSTSYTLLSGNNWADEWARYMYQTDGGATGNEGIQNVVTYSIGVQSSGNQCSNDTYGLIASMAKHGGGKFFNTASVEDLTSALSAILNEVQAVNSVFSSASLPVSVNAEGTYLNQIYLGMFRPDATGSPRWLGNLKQYKLAKDSTGSLVLVDKDGQSAISASGTGFLSPTAVSYWTSKSTTTAPDNITVGSYSGMFAANPQGTPLSGYDSPDGEVVEKGGAAQQLRKENLTANFTGASNTASTNPRRLYTYCPAGSSCNANLNDSSNDFATTNANISAGAFGAASTLKISSITRSGLTVTGTTNGNHGLSAGTAVTISGVSPSQYNGNYNLASASGNTFTYTIGAEYPNIVSLGTYSVTKSAAGAAISLSGASLSGTTVTINSASSLVAFGVGTQVKVDGFTQSEYNGTFTVTSNSGNSLTYTITISPPSPAANTYKAYYASAITRSISGITTTGSGVNRIATVTTTSSHNFHAGQTVTFANTTKSVYDGVSWPIATIVSDTQFTIATGNTGTTASTGTVSSSQAQQSITLTRSGTTATAAGLNAKWFTNGDTVTIVKTAGSATNESAYEKSSVPITCSGDCTSFTYTITTSPVSPATGTGFASVPGSTGSIAVGGITRTLGSTTAQAVMTISGGSSFATGDSVSISATGTPVDTESAYVGNFTISCTAPCSTFNISGLALTPSATGSGSNMSIYSSTTPPDRDTIIKWLRGSDNFGDELSPGGTVTVRPSVHADVLHSRPLVINYGDSRGIVVYYGTNDGVFHAVNGNQTAAIGSVAAGGELWGLVLTEHYSNINRQRIATPELKFPSTTVMTAATKDYFIDGPTGSFQQINPDGTVDKAYIFLTMRRGGRFIYALDVSTPSAPKFLWKISSDTPGFEELGQTWSRPITTLVQSSGLQQTPLVVFGAGYDSAEDSEPPGTDSMGRGLFIVNAATGALVWSATPSCTTSPTCLNVPGLTHAIASDVTFVDRDFDGYQDKIYVGDLGGNIWRADVADASTSNWKMTKVAALGCDSGTCAAGTAPRKFFFPPGVLTVKVAGATGSYDVLVAVSGDREHPLKNTASGSSYNVADKIFVIKDETTTVNPSTFLTTNKTLSTNLFNASSTKWDGSLNGFYMNLATGEKGVNAPNPVNGNFFFATNQPSDPSSTCAANLGTARAYAISPFTSNVSVATLSGGGLPPSSVAGLVELETLNPDGSTTVTEEKFCIGCGVPAPPGPNNPPGSCTGNSALQNCTPPSKVTGAVKRTYWYKK